MLRCTPFLDAVPYSETMALNDYAWRPITFEGVTFPPSVMGISILMSIPGATEESLDWLWRFRNCCGVSKSFEADVCFRAASLIRDLMVEHRQLVLDEIAGRLGPEGFDAEMTYQDWISALQAIASISEHSSGTCRWSAPSHPNDPIRTASDFKRAFNALNSLLDTTEAENS